MGDATTELLKEYFEYRECQGCGQQVPTESFERHRRFCNGGSSFAASDECPMCGAEYEQYLTHLRVECDQRPE